MRCAESFCGGPEAQPAMQRGSVQASYLSGSEAKYMMHAYYIGVRLV